MGRIFYSLLVMTVLCFPDIVLASGKRLVIGISQYPSTLHPNIESMAAKSYVLGLTHRPLTRYDTSWQSRCYLCVELPSIEKGTAEIIDGINGTRDTIKTTYTILEEARWGDGVPVTTDDVKFTYALGRHPLTGVSNAELYRRILDIEIVDKKTFTVHADRVTFSYNSIDDFRLLPAHIERSIFEEDPESYRLRSNYNTNPTLPGLWNGPYLPVELESGSYIKVERNPEWFGNEPVFDEIIIKAIENTPALEANLLSGELDMIEGSLGLPIDQALAFEKRHGGRFQVEFKPGLVYEHIDLMLDNPHLAIPEVRQALMYALDRGAINDQLFDGRQPPANSSVNPLDWVYDEAVKVYSYDPDKAAELLTQAGYKKGADDFLVNAEGQRLSFEIMTTSGNRSRELVQQVLQSMWNAIGIEIIIKNQPARVLFGETISKRQFTSMAMFAWISAPENVPQTTLYSTSIPSEANGWTGQNYTGYQNPQMDELIDKIETELNREKRKELWAKLQALYAKDLPALPLFFRANTHIWPQWLKNVQPTGHLAPVTLHVEDWQLEQQ